MSRSLSRSTKEGLDAHGDLKNDMALFVGPTTSFPFPPLTSDTSMINHGQDNNAFTSPPRTYGHSVTGLPAPKLEKSWLLQFFRSDFFSIWVGIDYLYRYTDIGIHESLFREMARFPLEQVELFLPQLCQLLILRPMQSTALEFFLIDNCLKSSHFALLLLWNMDAIINDLQGDGKDTIALQLCEKVLQKCQDILLTDATKFNAEEAQIKENIRSVVVSLGFMMGAVASPIVFDRYRDMLMNCSRRHLPLTTPLKLLSPTTTTTATPTTNSAPFLVAPNTTSNSATLIAESQRGDPASQRRLPSVAPPARVHSRLPKYAPSAEELHHGQAFAFQRFLRKYHARHHTASHSFLYPFDHGSTPRLSAQTHPLGSSLDTIDPPSSLTSVSSLPSQLDVLTQSLDLKAWNNPVLRRQHAFYAQFEFILTLLEIGERLFQLPKEARLSSLRAELALLNHNLPAIICLPGWCRGSTEKERHHRLVRIPPQDAVILNSKDRVPYLICIEVLECDDDDVAQRVDDWIERDVVHALSDAVRETAVLIDDHRLDSENEKNKQHHHQKTPSDPMDMTHTEDLSMIPTTAGTAFHVVDDCFSPATKVDLSGRFPSVLSPSRPYRASSAEWTMPSGSPPTPPLRRSFTVSGDALTVSAVASRNSVSMATSPASQPTTPPAHSRFPVSPSDSGESPSVALSSLSSHAASIAGMSRPASYLEKEVQSGRSPHPKDPSFSLLSATKERTRSLEDEIADCMRTASVMLAQLALQETTPAAKKYTAKIRHNIIQQLMSLEERRMAFGLAARQGSESETSTHTNSNGTETSAPVEHSDDHSASEGAAWLREDEAAAASWTLEKTLAQEDPSATVFKEHWEMKEKRIRSMSPYGHLASWKLISVIVKTGADLRQEQFALQLISLMHHIWRDAHLPLYLYAYRVLVTSKHSGIIETIRNTMSIHSLKKEAMLQGWGEDGKRYSLYDHFVRKFGSPHSAAFLAAQTRFIHSLAGYCLASYFLQLKDRHNGNILVDHQGHIIHIDFGFMLSNSPGSMGFELAPFKFTQEYVDLMDGIGSPKFLEFRRLLVKGFLALRKYADQFVFLVELMQINSKLTCFVQGPAAVTAFRDRFQIFLTESHIEQFVDRLITSSYNNVFTRLYDNFQHFTNGILP